MSKVVTKSARSTKKKRKYTIDNTVIAVGRVLSGRPEQWEKFQRFKDLSTGQNKRRHRNVTWYNPPYSKNVATNIGRTFPKILDDEFPENHGLHKTFNRNTVKVSYTCMTNIKQNIDGHNKAILKKDNPHHKTLGNGCNCKSPDKCPLPDKCLAKLIVYQATVTTNDSKPDQTYVGLTSNTFKTRLVIYQCK